MDERRKGLQEEEKALYRRYKGVAKKLEAENKAARAEVDKTRKVLARERGELASKVRNTAAEAEEVVRKARIWSADMFRAAHWFIVSIFSYQCAETSLRNIRSVCRVCTFTQVPLFSDVHCCTRGRVPRRNLS